MSDMKLTIILHKEVEDTEEAATLFEVVRSYMEQYPKVSVTGSVSNHFPREEDPPDG